MLGFLVDNIQLVKEDFSANVSLDFHGFQAFGIFATGQDHAVIQPG